ncbi:MAG: MFS transporter [Tannerella sp.]|jgi:fucose permease|nr:MFS transporter [Tannerella sp.]
MNQKNSLAKILPVMFGFFIMGIVDLIGTAINYVKADLSLNDTTANLLSLSCFLWFLILSVPTGFLMNRFGRKNAVLISFVVTLIGLVLPFVGYKNGQGSFDFAVIFIAFMFIGIGNTIIQVALNPLVTNVVSEERRTGTFTLGQFVKSLCSWLGPNIAAWLAASIFGWTYVFPIFAVITLIAAVWLWLTRINEEGEKSSISFAATFAILKNRKILWFFIGILVLVGVDVGLNATLPKYLQERCPDVITSISQADTLKSYFYFIVKALGAFVGGILLMKVSEKLFYNISALMVTAGLALMLISTAQWSILTATVIIALGYSNMFAIIFAQALKQLPAKANEISSLLIVGVSGGVIATLLGVISDIFGTQWAAMLIVAIIWLYMVWLIKPINAKDEA